MFNQKGNLSSDKPTWKSWAIIIGAVTQLIGLFYNISDYKRFAQAKDLIFSDAGWESYAINQYFSMAINVFLLVTFMGTFFIDRYVLSYKKRQLFEGLISFVLLVFWGTVGIVFQFNLENDIKVIWGIILLITFVGSVYYFYTYRIKS